MLEIRGRVEYKRQVPTSHSITSQVTTLVLYTIQYKMGVLVEENFVASCVAFLFRLDLYNGNELLSFVNYRTEMEKKVGVIRSNCRLNFIVKKMNQSYI